ncbi:type VII secretion protein EccE [Mycolicibacterium sp. CBMA 226]|uniref:type VII secretion protein EccE n=1 Tax=Mycolicibacterium sp. CBMA 226 TaxID=2606611 RepID=UPI0012DEAE9B|nr:type VII secretion protein EccE [Mycolicibacterium sp. CBMA 226]MUL78762.1 type VII secretion protein EccE [Mycolicibacterium sp. CBMA 226]QGW61054.1 ESX-2 secretion system protein EccE2 [Mycolicibacterium sp.]
MKARTLAVRPALGPVVAAEVVSLAAFAALPPHRFGWWWWAGITAVALLLLLITIHRRSVVMWVAARIRWMRERRHATPVGAAVDINLGGTVYGVRTGGHEAITMIRLDGRAYSPTFLRGSTVSLTANTLPLRLLVDQLDQPGDLHIGIDIVSDGFRTRGGAGYPELYSTLLADRPAAGQRTTRLIIRLDLQASVAGLQYRRSVGSAAAAVTERIINELEQAGVRAAAVDAAGLNDALEQLGLGLAVAPTPPERPAQDGDEPTDDDGDADDDVIVVSVDELEASDAGHHRSATSTRTRRTRQPRVREPKIRPKADVHWRTIDVGSGHMATYYFSAEDITTDTINQMWSLRSDHIVHMLMLRKQHTPGTRGDGQVLVSALVRTTDPRPPQEPPTLYLNTLPGDQYAAALRAAPTSQPALKLPARVLDSPDELTVPIGPTGILIGTVLRDNLGGPVEIRRDDLVLWALTDPQRPTRITIDTQDFFVRQLLIRAAAAGERIAIYSREPQRWHSIEGPTIAVVEARRPAGFVPTIIVNDRSPLAPSAGLSSTVITVGRSEPGAGMPDIRFQQTGENTVRVMQGPRALDIAIISFRQEQTWTGTGHAA